MQLNRNIKNLGLVLISLLLGILFWFYAKTDRIVTKQMKFPLKVIPPKEYIVIEQIPDSIVLNISTKKRTLQILHNITPRIALRDFPTGVSIEKLQEARIQFPFWLKIKHFEIIEPSNMRIELDSLIEKKVKVIISKGLLSNPDSVIIRGPQEIVEGITYISPDSLPTGNITTLSVNSKFVSITPNNITIEK